MEVFSEKFQLRAELKTTLCSALRVKLTVPFYLLSPQALVCVGGFLQLSVHAIHVGILTIRQSCVENSPGDCLVYYFLVCNRALQYEYWVYFFYKPFLNHLWLAELTSQYHGHHQQ